MTKRFRVILTVIPLLLLACGCTNNQLLRSTSQTQKSMSDLRYKHILDNLAMMVRNPATVPNPVAINGGVVQINDIGTAIGNITGIPSGSRTFQYFLGLTGSRTVSEQWSLTPLQNPEKLRLMRYAFQLLLNSDLVHYDDGEEKLRAFLGDEEFATAIPKGWFCVGKKHDVPRNARYCGSYHDVYVWVMDDGARRVEPVLPDDSADRTPGDTPEDGRGDPDLRGSAERGSRKRPKCSPSSGCRLRTSPRPPPGRASSP